MDIESTTLWDESNVLGFNTTCHTCEMIQVHNFQRLQRLQFIGVRRWGFDFGAAVDAEGLQGFDRVGQRLDAQAL